MSVTNVPTPEPAPNSPPRQGAEEHLSFVRTAPRHLVDRNAIAEILITDWRRRDEHVFRLGAQWPREHLFYTPVAGCWHDPLLVAESLRQAATLIARTFYDVPTEHTIVIDELDTEIVPGVALLSSRPLEIGMEVTCTEHQHEQGAVTGFTVEADLLRGTTFLGAGRVVLRLLSPESYRRLRGGRVRPPTDLSPLPDPLPAAIAGRLNEHDVVLGVPDHATAAHTWQLRVDPTHPVLFDHPCDHVPSMVLLEAARQATQAVCAPYRILPTEFRSAFHRRVEMDLPCHIAATELPLQDAGEETAVRVTGSQQQRLAFDSLVLASPCD
ncbi:hypothetical protein CDG81_10645 [Actinopolyspora erythraea]|uniref:A-factor biosynthesis hotdog domain-containing protein n=1 Tax=Actinopolyspora erythraea TaxID=414996 RepID=A0A223RS02_9ACTN|nr:ScbA/BarX family gamma-butyrolactone biosynthesis protein [Actinopolyspora erythraea]ASU78656.1 hypothetical protein CDG81_10645 [Actinopolyspora erythraea]